MRMKFKFSVYSFYIWFYSIIAFSFFIFSPPIISANVPKDTPCIIEAKALADLFINSPLYQSTKPEITHSLSDAAIKKLSVLLGRDLTKEELTQSNRIGQVAWNHLESHFYIQKAFAKAFSAYPCKDIQESLIFFEATKGQDSSENPGTFERASFQHAPLPLKEAEAVFLDYLRKIFRSFKIPSGAMLPTLRPGDHIWVEIEAYDNQHPKRGDIIVFPYPKDESKMFVKRIMGLPGEVIEMINKTIFLNGSKFADETFTQRVDPGIIDGRINPRDNFGPITVPPDSYFVMGDNRDQSLDSRFWGFLKREKILGKATLIYFSLDESKNDGLSKTILWERIGTELM